MIGIYKIENKINGKVYIGQSINIEQRWYNHEKELNRNSHHNKHLQHAWNKYGKDQFVFAIIEECVIDNIDDREIFWINELKSTDPNNGYNITIGGQGTHGCKWTNERRESFSNSKNPEAIVQLTLSGELVERWRSSSFAAKETGYSVSGIRNCVKSDGDQYQSHGYIWLLETVYFDPSFNISDYIKEHIEAPSRIIERDLYGKYIATWDNLQELGIAQNFNESQFKEVISNLKHGRRSCNGRIFHYEDDPFELTDDYLKDIRVKTGRYKINQFDNLKNFIKTWTTEELKKTSFRFDTIRKCCTDNLLGHKVNGTAFSYIWEYE